MQRCRTRWSHDLPCRPRTPGSPRRRPGLLRVLRREPLVPVRVSAEVDLDPVRVEHVDQRRDVRAREAVRAPAGPVPDRQGARLAVRGEVAAQPLLLQANRPRSRRRCRSGCTRCSARPRARCRRRSCSSPCTPFAGRFQRRGRGAEVAEVSAGAGLAVLVFRAPACLRLDPSPGRVVDGLEGRQGRGVVLQVPQGQDRGGPGWPQQVRCRLHVAEPGGAVTPVVVRVVRGARDVARDEQGGVGRGRWGGGRWRGAVGRVSRLEDELGRVYPPTLEDADVVLPVLTRNEKVPLPGTPAVTSIAK